MIASFPANILVTVMIAVTKPSLILSYSEPIDTDIQASPQAAAITAACEDDSDALVRNMLRKHDKRKVPTTEYGSVLVTVEIWVQQISKILELSSQFELDMYITEQWTDLSLSFGQYNPCKGNMSLSADAILDRIWTPSGCFVNSKNATIHQSPYRNVFLMIYANGTVWVNYRIKVVGPCVKDMRTFPIDHQRCYLTYESYTHNTDDVSMRWLEPAPVQLLSKVQLPDYKLKNISYIRIERKYPPGRWDELTVTFIFERLYGFYILQAYVPAYLTVFLSWVSFYLGSKAIPSRTTVGVNSLLALTFQGRSLLPRSDITINKTYRSSSKCLYDLCRYMNFFSQEWHV